MRGGEEVGGRKGEKGGGAEELKLNHLYCF